MPSLNLLYKDRIQINDDIYILIPTVGDIIDSDQDAYFNLVYLITAMPIDLMVPLDDMGIDFSKISDWELFLSVIWPNIREADTSLIFGDLDLANFVYVTDEETGQRMLYSPVDDVVIDRKAHRQITTALRSLHNLKKDTRRPGNKEAREYMLERARTKAKRKKRTQMKSELETFIVALVNTEQFKYNYETVKNLTIYQFNESVQQIKHKIDFEHTMLGIYSGTIDHSKLKPNQLNWLDNKKD